MDTLITMLPYAFQLLLVIALMLIILGLLAEAFGDD